MTRRIIQSIVTIAIAAVAMTVLAATSPSGISGSVSDRALAPLAGVEVPLRSLETGEIVRKTVTDASGRFAFSGVGGGRYIVEVVGAGGDLVAASAPVSPAAGSRPLGELKVSVPIVRSADYVKTASATAVFTNPIASEVVRAAVLAGITGSSIRINERGKGGKGKGTDTDSDTEKKPKTPKKPKDTDTDTDTDTDKDSDKDSDKGGKGKPKPKTKNKGR